MALAILWRIWGDLIPVLAGLVPVAVFVIFSCWDRQQEKKRTQSPQREKLLRPPGRSLSIKLDELVDKAMTELLLACGLCCLAAAGIEVAVKISGFWFIAFGLMGLVFGVGGAYLTVLVARDVRRCQNVRLGLRGEQAVAEALQEVADCGYRAFHDFPGGENWNIDHVVVGPPGVFLIETKARSRMRPRRGQEQPAHYVHVFEDRLQFPSGQDRTAIPQVERNAKWLADHLTKKTGENVEIEALVVLPGWFCDVKQPPPKGTSVMNATYLKGHLRRQPPRLPDAQMRRIIAALDEKCRDVEF
jgi:hypothetical protein